jgi:hypothetical protein
MALQYTVVYQLVFNILAFFAAMFRIRICMDPHSIGHLDPDPGGLKRCKMKKIPAKRQIIRHEKYKNLCNWYTNVIFHENFSFFYFSNLFHENLGV